MRCPNCNANNDTNGNFCIECGSTLTPEDINESKSNKRIAFQNVPTKLPKPQSYIKKRNEYLFLIIAIIVCLVIVTFIVSLVITQAMLKDEFKLSIDESFQKDEKEEIITNTIPKVDTVNNAELKVVNNSKNLLKNISFEIKDDSDSPEAPAGSVEKSSSQFIPPIGKIVGDQIILPKIEDPGFLHSQRKSYPKKNLRKDYLQIQSKVYKGRLPVRVMLPRSYDDNPDRYYPYLILFGGASQAVKGPWVSVRYWDDFCWLDRNYNNILSGGNESRIEKYYWREGLEEKMQERMEEGPFEEMIIILVHTFRGTPNYNYHTYLLKEVIPQLHYTYRLIPHPSFSGIDGACLGGAQSLLYGLRYPQVFASVGGVEANFIHFGERIHNSFEENMDQLLKNNVAITLNTATWDTYRSLITEFAEKAQKTDVTCHFNLFNGGHDYRFYRTVGGFDVIYSHGLHFGKAFQRYPQYRNVIIDPNYYKEQS